MGNTTSRGLIGTSYKPNFGSTLLQFVLGHGSWDDAKQTLVEHHAQREAMERQARDREAMDYYVKHGGQPHPELGYPKQAFMFDPNAMSSGGQAAQGAAQAALQAAQGGPSGQPMSPLVNSGPLASAPRMGQAPAPIQNIDPNDAPAPAAASQPTPAQAAQVRQNPGSLFFDEKGKPREVADVVRNPMYMMMDSDPDWHAMLSPVYQQWKDTRPEYAQMGDFVRNKNDPSAGAIFSPSNIPAGAQPVMDVSGNVVGYKTADGYINYLTETAGAQKGAEARAAAGYNTTTVAGEGGRQYTMTNQAFHDRYPSGIVGDVPAVVNADRDRAQKIVGANKEHQNAAATIAQTQQKVGEFINYFGDQKRGRFGPAGQAYNKFLTYTGQTDEEAQMANKATNMLQQQVIAYAKTLGPNPSDADRAFIQQANGLGSNTDRQTFVNILSGLQQRLAQQHANELAQIQDPGDFVTTDGNTAPRGVPTYGGRPGVPETPSHNSKPSSSQYDEEKARRARRLREMGYR